LVRDPAGHLTAARSKIHDPRGLGQAEGEPSPQMLENQRRFLSIGARAGMAGAALPMACPV
ncbi:MAG: hypothetical protein ACXWVJ_06455, partial [Caulobacteraceae bacterium]